MDWNRLDREIQKMVNAGTWHDNYMNKSQSKFHEFMKNYIVVVQHKGYLVRMTKPIKRCIGIRNYVCNGNKILTRVLTLLEREV